MNLPVETAISAVVLFLGLALLNEGRYHRKVRELSFSRKGHSQLDLHYRDTLPVMECSCGWYWVLLSEEFSTTLADLDRAGRDHFSKHMREVR